MKEDKFINAFEELKYHFQKNELSALDLGCGDTKQLSYLYSVGFKTLVAVDKKKIEHLDYLNQNDILTNDKLTFICDLSPIEVNDYFESFHNCFNLIILSNFLHRFEKEKSKEILNQCIQRLEPNGVIYICVANQNHKGWENKFDTNRYTSPELYDGPEWGMEILELTNHIEPLEAIYSHSSLNHIEVFAKTVPPIPGLCPHRPELTKMNRNELKDGNRNSKPLLAEVKYPALCPHRPEDRMNSKELKYGTRNSKMLLEEVYFWTDTIKDWQALLDNDAHKNIIIECWRELVTRKKIVIYGFVIMPNHLHILWGMIDKNGKEMPYASFNKFTSHQFLDTLRKQAPEEIISYKENDSERKHRFWQRDALAIQMDSKEKVEQKLDYTHLNPLQEKWSLVYKPEDYKWSSARFYETGIDEFNILTNYRERLKNGL